MASLTIRNIPDGVMERLRKLAAEKKRSMNSQVVHWIEDATRKELTREERDELFERIRASREEIYRTHGMGSDSGKLIRKMRDERTAHWMRLAEENRAKTGRRSRR